MSLIFKRSLEFIMVVPPPPIETRIPETSSSGGASSSLSAALSQQVLEERNGSVKPNGNNGNGREALEQIGGEPLLFEKKDFNYSREEGNYGFQYSMKENGELALQFKDGDQVRGMNRIDVKSEIRSGGEADTITFTITRSREYRRGNEQEVIDDFTFKVEADGSISIHPSIGSQYNEELVSYWDENIPFLRGKIEQTDQGLRLTNSRNAENIIDDLAKLNSSLDSDEDVGEQYDGNDFILNAESYDTIGEEEIIVEEGRSPIVVPRGDLGPSEARNLSVKTRDRFGQEQIRSVRKHDGSLIYFEPDGIVDLLGELFPEESRRKSQMTIDSTVFYDETFFPGVTSALAEEVNMPFGAVSSPTMRPKSLMTPKEQSMYQAFCLREFGRGLEAGLRELKSSPSELDVRNLRFEDDDVTENVGGQREVVEKILEARKAGIITAALVRARANHPEGINTGIKFHATTSSIKVMGLYGAERRLYNFSAAIPFAKGVMEKAFPAPQVKTD